jgi:hypothetical protein
MRDTCRRSEKSERKAPYTRSPERSQRIPRSRYRSSADLAAHGGCSQSKATAQQKLVEAHGPVTLK